MRARRALTGDEFIDRIHQLRRLLMARGATGVVVCQLKPMETTDVTAYNQRLHNYLLNERRHGRDGYGCGTQIRLEQLKADGYHVQTQFYGIIDRTYACAIRGINVPCPTPMDQFVPGFVRLRYESEWPSLGEGVRAENRHHGWRR